MRAPALTHEAMFYGTDDEYVAGVVPFVRAGLENDESVLVAVPARQIELLRSELGADARRVTFTDMAVLGRNPARIIPEWSAFVEECARDGRGARGVGEPIWPGRSPAELVECHRHEHLLNVAFVEGPAWSLLCPYDIALLPGEVIERARQTHPPVVDAGAGLPVDPLASPPADHVSVPIVDGGLVDLRALVADRARHHGLDERHTTDLVLAANEVATNTLMHTEGEGTLRIWRDGAVVLCEVSDTGHIEDPLADRTVPDLDREGGRGFWLANHLCDLVQVRSGPGGTIVRLHVLLDG